MTSSDYVRRGLFGLVALAIVGALALPYVVGVAVDVFLAVIAAVTPGAAP
jgi:hypothetical protein